MSVAIVQDHVHLCVGIVGNELMHEVEEFTSSSASVMTTFDLTSGDIESSKQGCGAMPLVAVVKSSNGLAVVQPQPPLRDPMLAY